MQTGVLVERDRFVQCSSFLAPSLSMLCSTLLDLGLVQVETEDKVQEDAYGVKCAPILAILMPALRALPICMLLGRRTTRTEAPIQDERGDVLPSWRRISALAAGIELALWKIWP